MRTVRFLLAVGAVLLFFLYGGTAMGGDKTGLRSRLTPEQFCVTQENGTERPFHNAFWDNKRSGIYVDVVSGEPLFSSLDKFDSGTGWPSFTRPLRTSGVVEKEDRSQGMSRVEVRSPGSDSHLGHVFKDGPGPSGLRYCINSAALRFIPAKGLEKEGYGRLAWIFSDKNGANYETATFAAGCFWGVQDLFDRTPGVVSTRAGYTGGTAVRPSYEEVCSGGTGHAEAVEVVYDSSRVSYGTLLELFWRMHDPTQKNRQGLDVGAQYRSVIFTHDADQRRAAEKSKEDFDQSGVFGTPAVTEIVPAGAFFPAEDYHQHYVKKTGHASCPVLRKK